MKAVIFDMDGVIVDSEPLHVKAEKEVCRRYNIQVEDNDWLGFKGKTTIDIFSFNSDTSSSSSGPNKGETNASRFGICENTICLIFRRR